MGCGPSKNSTQSTLEPLREEGFGHNRHENDGSFTYQMPPAASLQGPSGDSAAAGGSTAGGDGSSAGGGSSNGASTAQASVSLQQQQQQQQQLPIPSALTSVPQAPSQTLAQQSMPLVLQQPASVVSTSSAVSGALMPPVTTPGNIAAAGTTTAVVNGTANALHISNSDAQWKDLWEALSPHLLDPSDVTAVIAEVMNQTTNRLLSTDVNFVLRRIRHVVRNLARTNGNFAPTSKIKMGVWTSAGANNSNSLEAEGKLTAERHHLLSFHVLRRVLGAAIDIPRPDGKEAAMVFPDPVEAAYTLLLYLSEPICERAAVIAQKTAKNAGLEMDVNKGRNFSQRPPPVGPSKEELPDLPPGITVQAYSFLLALALRKL